MMNTNSLPVFNTNCSRPSLVFNYGCPMFFAVGQSADRRTSKKRSYSAFASQQPNEDLCISTSKRAGRESVQSRKRNRSVDEEIESVTIQMKKLSLDPSLDDKIKSITSKMSKISLDQSLDDKIESLTSQMGKISLDQSLDDEIKSITSQMDKLSLDQSLDDQIKSITSQMNNLSLKENEEEKEIKIIYCLMSKLSLTQSQMKE